MAGCLEYVGCEQGLADQRSRPLSRTNPNPIVTATATTLPMEAKQNKRPGGHRLLLLPSCGTGLRLRYYLNSQMPPLVVVYFGIAWLLRVILLVSVNIEYPLFAVSNNMAVHMCKL